MQTPRYLCFFPCYPSRTGLTLKFLSLEAGDGNGDSNDDDSDMHISDIEHEADK
jgi:hypothetical protein